MKIIHDSAFDASYLRDYEDVEYFRLYHSLQNIKKIYLQDIWIETAKILEIPTLVDIINKSYKDISVTREQMLGDTKKRGLS